MLRPFFVYILNIWPDEPIYHRSEDIERWRARTLEERRTQRDWTACGRPVSDYKPQLPHKHARKFARPCKGCFPDGVRG